jgi:ACR3 family arsenite efflux pump ArsB
MCVLFGMKAGGAAVEMTAVLILVPILIGLVGLADGYGLVDIRVV